MIKSTLKEGLEDYEFVVNYFELPIFMYKKNVKHPLTLLKELWINGPGLPLDIEIHLICEIEYFLLN